MDHDEVPIYDRVSKLCCWLDHAQLKPEEWERLFSLASEFGFVDPKVH